MTVFFDLGCETFDTFNVTIPKTTTAIQNMTDAQFIFDSARQQYNEFAGGLERHFESVATQLKDWLPEQMRPRPPPPPPPSRFLTPATYWNQVNRWVARNTALSAGILAFVGTGAVLVFIQRTTHVKKRRARKSNNGARTEAVVLAGSPTSPLTTAIAMDLERRGFIVYVVTGTKEDEEHLRKQSRADVLPFDLDLIHPDRAEGQMQRFHHFLSRHHHAFDGASAHRLTLAGVILVPDISSVTVGSIAQLSPEAWSTALNAKVLHTITVAKYMLPLVTEFKSRVLILTPNVVSSLRPPYRAVESTVSSAIGAFAASLSSELSLQGLHACHFKLGNIEIAGSKHKREEGKKSRGTPGTSIRKLHEAIFDALHSSNPSRTWHVGRGSLIYDFIGSWIPSGVVGWMMGLQHVATNEDQRTPEPEDSSSDRSITWEKV
ncbi:hypothetical protein AUEXF2481DRAFT_8753 [Aureobasidium subglaciale EXF-2481]|uniref:DUF1776-domain-containing protein n=1 Tax=Aureobasidium subglaciale (strain EXF-2481) TaxID=1043005 RepID=A0A074Y5E0_AURSE|nr:uncharacterized protein AUEXF2481DRAFT_8753 [Aureobasidium subglaciale EXF-2481]KAI5196536.1 DUF1776-domain-containing protein [Aureobasidium subglaciale]KAI5215334.1 DUF1776-domain-containing protein [Aureobasidium subglaciale]KAI5218613.1 DUF1776-domain-containing protein [Aureobasidium subglaciale]KAI5256144.1 DUF1776-domain-containing protein [Aureobasidium subglaciale]KEQ91134.1 hypothetical protein AUEXF2481DRAFT_8753 [Aureobasidium subglaciale EXF-2481]